MSKRELSHNEEEKLPGNSTVKKVKTSQTSDISTNGSLSPSKQKHNQITNLFKINTLTNKSAHESDDEKETTIMFEKPTKITEIVLDSDSDVSYYSQDEENEVVNPPSHKIHLKRMPNVMFYLNMVASQPQGDYIDKIQIFWKNDYKKLEIHHGFIQWLFPNFYVSGFNRDAFKLTTDEAKLFRDNKEIAERLVRSYELILGFFGIRLANRRTGELERAANFEERYRSALIMSPHNHMRVKRVLAHLNVVGFRQYAIQFVNFLEMEIFGEEGGYLRYTEELKPLRSEYTRNLRLNPLYPLIKYDVFKEWKVYGYVTSNEERELLYKNCFTSDERDYEPSILLRY